jgi:hypothetical protein
MAGFFYSRYDEAKPGTMLRDANYFTNSTTTS